MSLKTQFSNVKVGDVGIIGDPIEHSLSPIMQSAALKIWEGAFRDREMPSPTYHRFLVKTSELGESIHLMKDHGMRGVNVTIPHKVTVCDLIDSVSPFAKRVGAVNTLAFSKTDIAGHNTDAEGFKRAITRDMDFEPEQKTAFVLGAGGTGRVIALTLLDMGLSRVYLWNRNADTLEDVVKNINDVRITSVQNATDIAQASRESHLIVNATSVGLKAGDSLPVAGVSFNSDQFVFDVVYNRETAFLAQAKKAGAKTADGLGMLVYQGARSFEIWTGSPAPIDVMRHALSQKLKGV